MNLGLVHFSYSLPISQFAPWVFKEASFHTLHVVLSMHRLYTGQ